MIRNATLRAVCETILVTDLTDREKKILIRRVQGETLQSIGDSYSVGRNRIRQIEDKASRKLRFRTRHAYILLGKKLSKQL